MKCQVYKILYIMTLIFLNFIFYCQLKSEGQKVTKKNIVRNDWLKLF